MFLEQAQHNPAFHDSSAVMPKSMLISIAEPELGFNARRIPCNKPFCWPQEVAKASHLETNCSLSVFQLFLYFIYLDTQYRLGSAVSQVRYFYKGAFTMTPWLHKKPRANTSQPSFLNPLVQRRQFPEQLPPAFPR